MKGFFPSKATPRHSIPLVPQCGVCGLHKTCNSPKMPVHGKGRKRIMVVGEAPGQNEDEQGIPFVGKSGDLLWSVMAKYGVERDDCWTTNSARCRPPNNKYPDKTVDHCRPYLIQAVKEHKPEVIILLGAKAVQSLLGWLYRPQVGLASRWDGWTIPVQKINAWVCPTWHPSYILRTDYGESGKREDWKGDRDNEVRRMLFEQHLEAACKLKGRPWKEVPDYKKKIGIIVDPDEAADVIRLGLDEYFDGPVALDYETNMLKPDSNNARIVSCALSNGKATYAYPWHGEAIKATGELIRSKVPKIASHMSFEQRWCLKEFGTAGRNWRWDTMTTAHVLNNQPGISGIEFQAFALLGQEPWDEGVSEYLTSKGGANAENRIREAPLERLLRYNALDSLLEFEVAQIQARQLGIEL